MEYILTFLEGIATFLSPCMLPMIPIYLSYFSGFNNKNKNRGILNSIAFVIGFTIVFLMLAIISSFIGMAFGNKIRYLKIVFGIIIIILGLNYLGIIDLKLKNNKQIKIEVDKFNFKNSLIFGMLFSISFTPCVGTFLGAALITISEKQELIKGIVLIIIYSFGLGIPFIISSILIEKIKQIYFKIKNIYGIIKNISGIVLIISGIYIMFF